jgi:hypothetical protein
MHLIASSFDAPHHHCFLIQCTSLLPQSMHLIDAPQKALQTTQTVTMTVTANQVNKATQVNMITLDYTNEGEGGLPPH